MSRFETRFLYHDGNSDTKELSNKSRDSYDQIQQITGNLKKLKKELKDMPMYREIFNKLRQKVSNEFLQSTAIKRQYYLQAKREEFKKIEKALRLLKQQEETKYKQMPSNLTQDNRLRQLVSSAYIKKIQDQIQEALQCQNALSLDIAKTLKTLRLLRRRLKIRDHPYYPEVIQIGYEPEPEGCTLLRCFGKGKCGPASLAMILSLYNREVYGREDSPELVAEKFDPSWINKTGGTHEEDFPEVLRRCGHPIPYTSAELESLDKLEEKLSPDASGRVHPVIAFIIEEGDPHGHFIVIQDIEQGKVWLDGKEYEVTLYKILDPYDGSSYKVTRENFNDMWPGRVCYAEEALPRQEIDRKRKLVSEPPIIERPPKRPTNEPPISEPLRPANKPSTIAKPLKSKRRADESLVTEEPSKKRRKSKESRILREIKYNEQNPDKQTKTKRGDIEKYKQPKRQYINDTPAEEEKYQKDSYLDWSGLFAGVNFGGGGSPIQSRKGPDQDIDEPAGGGDYPFLNRDQPYDPDENSTLAY